MPCRSFPPKKLESRGHHRKTNTNRTVDEWSGTQGRNWEKLTVQPHTFLTAWIGSRGNLYPRPCKRALKDLSNHLRVATRGYVASTPAHVQAGILSVFAGLGLLSKPFRLRAVGSALAHPGKHYLQHGVFLSISISRHSSSFAFPCYVQLLLRQPTSDQPAPDPALGKRICRQNAKKHLKKEDLRNSPSTFLSALFLRVDGSCLGKANI